MFPHITKKYEVLIHFPVPKNRTLPPNLTLSFIRNLRDDSKDNDNLSPLYLIHLRIRHVPHIHNIDIQRKKLLINGRRFFYCNFKFIQHRNSLIGLQLVFDNAESFCLTEFRWNGERRSCTWNDKLGKSFSSSKIRNTFWHRIRKHA